VNLDEVNIAITHNYVSGSNLSSVLKFLDGKRDQVSGCRDRDESIKPENLFEEFKKALQNRYPDLAKRALENPGWNCNAWKTAQETSVDGHKSKTNVVSEPSVMSKAACGGGFSFSFM